MKTSPMKMKTSQRKSEAPVVPSGAFHPQRGRVYHLALCTMPLRYVRDTCPIGSHYARPLL